MIRPRQPRPGKALAAPLAAILALLLPARATADEFCEDDPMADLVAPAEECRRDADPPKIDKVYPALGAAARGKGIAEIATTLYSVHSKEALPVFAGTTPPPALLRLFFRCRGFGVQRDLDPRLLEAALAAAAEFESPRVEVVSAYRSAKMNETLSKKGRRVASESRHIAGEALDFRLPTARARRIAEWLWARFEGGLGVYDRDDFVHIDVGPKRRWKGR